MKLISLEESIGKTVVETENHYMWGIFIAYTDNTFVLLYPTIHENIAEEVTLDEKRKVNLTSKEDGLDYFIKNNITADMIIA